MLGAGSLLALPLVELRPNRLTEGPGIGTVAAAGWLGVALVLVWLAVVVLALTRLDRDGRVAALAGNLGLVLLGGSLAVGSRHLLVTAAPYARVSLAAGAWSCAIAVYVVLFAAARAWQRPRRAPADGDAAVGDAVTGAAPSRRWFNGDAAAAARRLAGMWWGVAVVVAMGFVGAYDHLSLARELAANGETFVAEASRHLQLAGAGVALGALIGVPLGVLAQRRPGIGRAALAVTSVFQTIPSLALLGLLLAPLAALSVAVPWLKDLGVGGLGAAPAIIALTVYGLLPVVRNTYTGLVQVDPAVKEAGFGMGMTSSQLLARIELPLALPLVLEGVRTAAVQLLGITALVYLIGAGGLGRFVFLGIGQQAPDLILLGALPIIGLAVVADRLLVALAMAVTPRGVRVAHTQGTDKPSARLRAEVAA